MRNSVELRCKADVPRYIMHSGICSWKFGMWIKRLWVVACSECEPPCENGGVCEENVDGTCECSCPCGCTGDSCEICKRKSVDGHVAATQSVNSGNSYNTNATYWSWFYPLAFSILWCRLQEFTVLRFSGVLSVPGSADVAILLSTTCNWFSVINPVIHHHASVWPALIQSILSLPGG